MIAHLSSWGDARGIRADWPALVDAWRMDYPPSLDRVRRGERAWANLDVLHRESFERLVPKFGVPAQDNEGLNALARFWHELPAWPDVVGGLHRLKPRYMIAPLSNGHVALLVSMSKSLGLPWDMIFGADLFRHYKPDPETYLGAAALFGCAPGEVFSADPFCGDTRQRPESKSADGVFRDGLRAGGEAPGARRGDPRCPDTPLALDPVPTGRASTMKSPPRSSPSWRPAGVSLRRRPPGREAVWDDSGRRAAPG